MQEKRADDNGARTACEAVGERHRETERERERERDRFPLISL